jgi:hypothetical protein
MKIMEPLRFLGGRFGKHPNLCLMAPSEIFEKENILPTKISLSRKKHF